MSNVRRKCILVVDDELSALELIMKPFDKTVLAETVYKTLDKAIVQKDYPSL